MIATDWPGFRGANRDGRVLETRIATDWTASSLTELWRIPVGPGWSSFAAVGNRLVTQEQRGESEVVVCYDLENGGLIWRHVDASRFSEIVSGAGPRSTPTYANGRIYTLGGRALLNCLDAATGQPIWQRDLMSEIDAKLPTWGFSSSPLVVDDRVILYANGADDHGVVAYDAATGARNWHVATRGTNYSSAQPCMFGGRTLVLLAGSRQLNAIDPVDGTVQWEYSHEGERSMAIVQPQQIDETSVIVPFGDSGGLARLSVELMDGAWEIDEVWTSRDMKPSFNDFVHHEGYLYGFDQNLFCCLDAETGERCWKRGRYGFGQVILFAEQGLLLVASEQGELVLLEADPDSYSELASLEAIGGKTWNHPVVVRNRLVIRNGSEAVCYALPVDTT